MNTDRFIDILVQDEIVEKPRSLALFALFAGGVLLLISLLIYALTGMAFRPDYWASVSQPLVLSKQLLPLLLLLSVFPALARMRYPEAQFTGKIYAGIGVYLAIMVALFAFAWQATPADLHGMAIVGKSRLKCLVSIPLYSWIALGVVLLGLKGSAPQNPRLMALFAAIFAAAIGTIVYAFGCTEDSPLFYALWYNLAIFIASIGGGLIAWRVLKW